jgi:hypothetical protein
MNWNEITDRLGCYRMALDGVEFDPIACDSSANPVDFCLNIEEQNRVAVDEAMLYLIANNELPPDVEPIVAAFAQKRILYGQVLALQFAALYATEFSSSAEPPSDEARLRMVLIDLWPDYGVQIWKAMLAERAAGYADGKGAL